MSLDVKLRGITRLKGKGDRFCVLTFREVSASSNVNMNTHDEAMFDEDFYWPLEYALDKDEWLELRLFNRNKFFQDRLIGAYRFSLASIVNGATADVMDNLIDTRHNILKAEVLMEVTYTPPIDSQFIDVEQLSLAQSKSRTSLASSSTRAAAQADLLEDKEIYHPIMKHPKVVNVELEEWIVQVRIIEAQDLAGVSLDPSVCVTLGDDKKHTSTKKQTNNPEWDELFIFDAVAPTPVVLDRILKLEVFTGRTLISEGDSIGMFKCDMWYIFEQPDGSVFSKWAPLLDGFTTEIKGYLRVDLQIFTKGDVVKDAPPRKEDLEIDQNLILPPKINPYRPVHQYQIKVFAAEGIPQMNANLMANIKKSFTKKQKDLADPFVEIQFAGCTARTPVMKSTYSPEFNQLITFVEFFPPLCKRVKIQLKDSDISKNEVIGTHFIDLTEIANDAERSTGGFMPTFGPSWINLYGATRDYDTQNEYIDLSSGLGEGIAYRGRLLLWMDCQEAEPSDTGICAVEECDPLPKDIIGKPEVFQLFTTFYEASMIPRSVGEKPIQFEVTIGEYGFVSKHKQKQIKTEAEEEEIELIDEDELYQREQVFVQSLTPAMKPIAPEKKYYHIPFGGDKPCTNIKFPFEDQTRRHYNSVLLEKVINILEGNLHELEERIRCGLPRTRKLLKRFLGDVCHSCSLFIDLADGRKTGTHLGKNKLDRERDKLCSMEVKHVSEEAANIAMLSDDESQDMNELHNKAKELLKRIKVVAKEPQHGLPDVFIWMLSGNRRLAYARIPAEDILYSKIDSERGPNCGRVQTVLLRLPGKRGHGQAGWAIQAKIEIRLWLGLLKHKSEYLKDAPNGFDMDPQEYEEALSTLAIPPPYLHYTEKQKFVVRAHLFQARNLIGSDETGLSDAFLRCVVTHQPKDTNVVWETRSPTWDVMLKYTDIELWGDVTEFAVNPPLIILEVFDQDPGGDEEFIGRALAKPVVKLAEEKYDRPFFPPILQWFPIYRGELRAGDVLGAFEMLQDADDLFTELPPDPPEVETEEGNYVMRIPDNIRPAMQQHRIEILFWGVRDIKKIQFMSANRPVAELDCCYKVKMQDGEEKEIVRSVVIKSAKRNPNFENGIALFDVWLPEKEKYLPPMTIHVLDCRAFGRQVLCGTHVIESLHDYFMDPAAYEPPKPSEAEEEGGKKKKGADTSLDIDSDDEEKPLLSPEPEEKKAKKGKKGEAVEQDEELLDWWTRFFETLKDMEGLQEAPKKTLFGKALSFEEENKEGRANVSRLTVFMDELENRPEFGGFTDFVRTFNLLRGKKTDDDEEEDAIRRYAGKFKGNVRVWEYPLPKGFDPDDPMGTYQKVPSTDPVDVLVRVYVVRCLNLHPMDPNGKADPYLVCTLGKKTYNLKKEYCSKTLDPEYGKCFEFNAVIPFDNTVKVSIYDWDMLSGDDLIGETCVDIENLYYSKHRASCGIQKNYYTNGYAKWRDPQKPTSILTKLCKEYAISGPHFGDGVCTVGGKQYNGIPFVVNEKGVEVPSDEPCALEALHHFEDLAPKGFNLVPEYVETRSLYSPEKKGIEMGRVQMWIDMFPMDLTMPGEPVNIAVRKPLEYELRVVIWNTEDVLPDETNVLTGESSSDIFIKGWLEGNREDIQETDVHYRSLDGSGMFNWRFVFPFKFHKAEEKIVTFKRATLLAVDLTEEKHKPLIYLQVWDADLFSSDDFIGDAILNLLKLPCPTKMAKQCRLDMALDPKHPTASLFKIKKCKGWWPFIVNPEDDDDPDPILAGKVEAEFELLLKEAAEADPAGKKREEPHPLEKPNRPNDSFFQMMGPLTMLRYLIWEPYKFVLLKLLVVAMLLMVLVLFLYSMPGYTIKKIMGA